MEKTKNKGLWARLTAGIASFALALGVGVALANAEPMEARADDKLVYTLASATGGTSGYAEASNITQDGIAWGVTANTTMDPWRIGGKSLSGVDRTVYSKTALANDISKVELVVGAASSITVNSLTLIVASNSSFGNVISQVSETFVANSTITFSKPEPGSAWSNAYYKFVFNVTVSGSSNKFVEFKEARFFEAVSTETVDLEGISIDEACEVGVGQQITLTPTFNPTNASNKDVEWSSDNEAVATVSDKGIVTGVAEGKANITVTADDGGFTDSCEVTVSLVKGTAAAPFTVPEAIAAGTGTSGVYTIGYIESIEEVSTQYHNATFTICDGFGDQKTASLYIFRAKNLGNTNFTSADEIAIGDQVVIYGNLGTYNEQLQYSQNSYLTARTPDTATALHLSSQKLSFKLGEAFSFGGTVTADMKFQGEKALTEADLTFDPAIGTTFAKADLGNKEVSVTYAGHTEKYNITIGYADPTGVSLDEHSIKLSKNSDAIITATVANAATAEQVVEWSYDSTLTKGVDYLVDEDDNVVMISSKAVAGTITVTANVGEFSDSCVITITADPILTLDHDSFEGFSHDGQDYELHAHYENFADDVELFWGVNPTEGVIDLIDHGDNAMFTMVGAGTATITVTALDGEDNELEASCTVTVTESQVNTLVLNETSKMVFGGDEFDLTATLTTQGAATKDVVWTSSNEDVAIVVDGHVSTENVSGTAIITATSGYAYGEKKSASCELTVVASINEIGSEASTSKTFSEMGYSNQQAIESVDLGAGISVAFNKGTNSNAPKYYDTGSAIRAYGGNTFTVTGNGLKEIVLSFASGEGSNAITTNVGTYSDGTWTGNANSVTFTVGGSSGHRRIASIAVTALVNQANVNLLAQKAVLEFVDFMNAKMNEDGVCQANEKELHSGLDAAWAAVAEKYEALFGENTTLDEANLAAAKAMLTNVDAKWCEAGEEKVENSLERAMATYEHCVKILNCNAFMEGVRTVNPVSNSIFGNANNGNSVMLGFLLVAVAGAAAAGGYLLLRRRKEDR